METTLNIHHEILKQISKAAEMKRISRSLMIMMLLHKMMDDIENPDCLWKMVRYQKREDPGEWHTFHLVIRPDDYEYFLDLRKLLKMSVSLILAFAVKKYLNKLTVKIFTDNYRYKNYILMKEYIGLIL
jgi:hypothetical protein